MFCCTFGKLRRYVAIVKELGATTSGSSPRRGMGSHLFRSLRSHPSRAEYENVQLYYYDYVCVGEYGSVSMGQ